MSDKPSIEDRMKTRWGKVSAQAQSPMTNPALESLHKKHIALCLDDITTVLRESTVEYAAQYWDCWNKGMREDSEIHTKIQSKNPFFFGNAFYALRQSEAATGVRGTITPERYFQPVTLDRLASVEFRQRAGEFLDDRALQSDFLNSDLNALRATNKDRCPETAENWTANSTHEVLALSTQGLHKDGKFFLLENAKAFAMFAISAPHKTSKLEDSMRSCAEKFAERIPHLNNIGLFIAKINNRANTIAALSAPQKKGKPDTPDNDNTVTPLFGRN